tara:strand:+ start:3205 stop:5454 length:2250 start_codon:yes stop_codon:yes gene_type:complete
VGEIILKNGQFLSKHKVEILKLIEKEKRICINSNPGSGKTRLIIEMCKDLIKSGNSNRIVFCAPFIIIQNQFESELTKDKIKIDLSLNHLSPRKKLISSDRIITSTLQSFKKISEELTENDIVVIDEAHILATSFGVKPTEKEFYDQEILSYLNTDAKLVLLSGTPNNFINKLFEATTLNVINKNEIQSVVSLSHSNYSPTKIARTFAKQCIKQHGINKLNIIYIKDRRQCELIKDELVTSGYTTAIINTSYKKSEVYEDLKNNMKIPIDTQFLICTNLISTGTNIINENVGMALMINETSPKEIKQFSKRFRRQLDIDILIVITPSIKKRVFTKSNTDKEVLEAKKSLENYFSYYEKVLELNLPRNFEVGYNDPYLGTERDIQNTMVKRIIERISFINDLEADRCIDLKNLNLSLKEFSDIKTKGITMLPIQKGTNHLQKTSTAIFEKEISKIRQRFIINPIDYQNAICESDLLDYYLKESLKELNGFYNPNHKLNNQTNSQIEKDISHPYFDEMVMEPLLDLFPFIQNSPHVVYLLEVLNSRTLNKLRLSMLASSFREQFFTSSIVKNKVVFKIAKPTLLSSEQKLFAEIVIKIMDSCIGSKSIAIDLLLDKVNKVIKAKSKKVNLLTPPLKDLLLNGKLNSEKLKALVSGLIYSKPKSNKIKYSVFGEKQSIVFETQYPTELLINPKSLNDFLSKCKNSLHYKFDDKGIPSKMTFGIGGFIQIFPNIELLIYNHVKNLELENPPTS